MKKYILLISTFGVLSSIAQNSNHRLYAGSNLSGINLDLSTSGINGIEHNDFSEAQIGFVIGYKYLLSWSSKLTLGIGIELNNFNNTFYRPYYNDPNTINPNLSSVREYLKFYRVSVPLQGYYNFFNKNGNPFYISFGGEIILTNRINRTSDYKIQSPPSGYVDGRFKGKQKIKFNSGSIGLSIIAAIGHEFIIKDKSFFIELAYNSDISKNKILTLHNIEADNFYFGNLKSIQLKVGHTFSFSDK